MKKLVVISSVLLASVSALAQKEQAGEPYWKNHWESVLKKETTPAQEDPTPGAYRLSGEQLQRLLKNREQQSAYDEGPGDSIHIAKLDRMPVLMPDLRRVEKMPGSHPYTPAPPSKMPNPLYPRKKGGNDF